MSRATLLMCAALLLNMIGFANYAAVLPGMLADLHFSAAQAGVAGGIFFLGYALGSPVFSTLTDRIAARHIYLLGTAFGLGGGLAFPLVDDSYAMLLASRLLSGLCMGAIYMPGLRLLLDVLPADRQTNASSIYASTITLGLSASFALSAALEMLVDWPAAFLGAAVCAALAGILVRFAMPAIRPPESSHSLLRGLWAVLRQPGARIVALATAGNSWEGMCFRTWWVALLTFVATQPGNGAWAGLNYALMTAFVGLLAMPLSTWVAVRAKGDARYRVTALAAGSAVATGLLLIVGLELAFLIVFAITVLYVCTIFSDTGALPAAMLDQSRDVGRGAALAVMAASSNLGAFASITLTGFVIDHAGGLSSPGAWRWTILVMLSGSAVAALSMLWLHHRTRPGRRTRRPQPLYQPSV